MKLIVFLGVCFVCTSQVLSGVVYQIGDEIVARKPIDPRIKFAFHNRTGFMDLDADCIHTVFNYLELFDLLSLAEGKEELVFIVGDALKKRFATKRVFLELESMDYRTYKVVEKKDQITFYDRNNLEFLKVLHMFSPIIPNLHIIAGSTSYRIDLQRLFEQINVYCSKYLTDLTFLLVDGDKVVDPFKTPFKRVENLRIRLNFDLMNNSLAFTDMFPALQRLSFDHGPKTLEWADQKFPHLNYFDPAVINEKFLEAYREFFENNDQIKTLVTTIATKNGLKVLQMISETLPQLDRLEIYDCKEGGNESIHVHFEHLKTLVVRFVGPALPINVTFGQIVELVTPSHGAQSSHRWVELVKHQKTLKKLTVRNDLKEDDILAIANANSSLTELTYKCSCEDQRKEYRISYDKFPLRCSCSCRVESIIEMITRNKHLEKFHLYSGWAATNQIFEAMKNQLPAEWTISRTTVDGNDYVLFEKKEIS